MAKKHAEKPKARSPYVKYGKSPFKYQHPTCKHTNSTMQSVPATKERDGWIGHVCCACNIITGKSDRRYIAEAA